MRILAIPALVAFLYTPTNRWDNFWGALIFALAFWTDMFDGYIARRTRRITLIGRVLDPLADKLLVLAAILLLVRLGRLDVIVSLLLLGREMVISGLRALAGADGIQIASVKSAKWKAFAEGFALSFLLLGPDFSLGALPLFPVGRILIFLALALALWSAGIYFRNYFRAMANLQTP